MDDLLKGVGAVVAVLASLAAVALAVDQFTLRTRLRKTEEWAVRMLTEDLSEARTAVLRDIRVDATARIVAGVLMPTRFFVVGAVFVVLGPAGATLTLMDDTTPVATKAIVLLVVVVSLTPLMRQATRMYLERCRIAAQYRRDVPVKAVRWGLMDRMEGGLRVEFSHALGFSFGATAIGAGVGLALSDEDVNGWPLVLMVVGGFAAFSAVDRLRAYAAAHFPMSD